MTLLEIAKNFKNHKSGRRIAIVMLKNHKKKSMVRPMLVKEI